MRRASPADPEHAAGVRRARVLHAVARARRAGPAPPHRAARVRRARCADRHQQLPGYQTVTHAYAGCPWLQRGNRGLTRI